MKRSDRMSLFLVVLMLLPACAQTKQWWMDEPVRLILVLINENQSALDPFFNASGQRMWDNDGKSYPPCNCDHCKRQFRRRPGLNVMLARADAAYVDFFNSEIHGAGGISDSPYWLYTASQTVNSARTTFPNHLPFDNDAACVDNAWRYCRGELN